MDVLAWVRVQMMLMDAATALVSFAANWLLQSTLLIAVGLAAARLLRDRGAATQSAIFRTTLAAALACPLATSLLARCGVSGWSLEMPTAWTYEVFPAPVADDAATAAIESELPAPAPESIVHDELRIAGASLPMDAANDAAVFEPQPPPGNFSPGVPETEMAKQLAPASEPASVSPNVARQAASVRVPTATFDVRAFGLAAIGMALAWLAASAVLMVRLLRAWRRLQQLRCAAAPAELAAQNACRELAALLNVSAPELLRSPYLASPCLAGLRRPAVLLPEANPALPIRDVLIHELAHLRRRDGHWNLLRRLAEAAFFYQPLLWLLARRLEAAAEEVCDDYVVHFGGNRERYARGLVEIAELSAVPLGAAGVAMVSLRSILARRIVRILDSSRSLSTRVGNLLLAVVIAAGLGGVMAAGFVGLGSQRSQAEAEASANGAATADDKAGDAPSKPQEQEDKAAIDEPQEKPAAENEQTQKQSEEAKAAPQSQLEGVVAGANGKPVAGAKLYWLRSRVHDIDPQPPQLLATADKDGRYRIVEPPPVPAETPASWEYMDRIVIVAPGHGFKFTSTGELRREMGGAEGLVPALARAFLGGRKGLTILPPASDPIRGRLVDVNGQPVAGAKVRIRWFADAKDQLDGVEEAKARGVKNPVWQGRVDNLLNVIEPVQLRDALPSAVSDANGKFELRDLGVGRLVQLLVEGDGIEATEIVARNEPGEKIVLDFDRHEPGRTLTVYANDFLHAVGPSKPVTGRVLDLDSGKPIADAIVRAFKVHGEQVSSSREREHFAVRTNAEGRYRITGLPVGKENELVAFAAGDAPYLPVARDADTSAPGDELALDFRLKRGVWAEGRVYDAETRKPFTGEISYYFFRDRKQEEAIPGLKDAYADGLYWTNADGEFRVPVLPTRGILAFRYDGFDQERDGIDRFARGFGADKIAGSEDLGGAKGFPTAPFYLMPTNYERIAEVPATEGQQTVRVEMPLFASPPVTVRVVNTDGQPATRFQTYGANERWGWQNQDGPQFEIQDLQPGERRKVLVFRRETNLGGGAHVKYGEKEVVEIKLVRCGSVRGRLLDADGEPIDDATLSVQYEKLQSDDNSAIWAPHPDLRSMPTNIPVDKAGRFHLEGLIPGWSYHAYASARRELNGRNVPFIIGTPFADVQVEPGEEKDLGDVTAEANKPNLNKDEAKDSNGSQAKPSKDGTAQKPIEKAAAELAKTTTNATADTQEVEFAGIVTDAVGKSVAGAEIWLVASVLDEADLARRPIARRVADSDSQGKFAFRLAPLRRDRQEAANWIASLDLVAKAPGRGYDWLPLAVFEKNPASSSKRDELQQRVDKALGDGRFAGRALKLPLEVGPVRGRLIDVEGRPLAGVTVSVETIQAPNLAILDRAFETSLRDLYYRAINTTWRPSRMGRREWQTLMSAVKTNENGEFSLPGLGRGQMATVTLAGERVAAERLYILGREMETKRIPHLSANGAKDVFVGAHFTHAVGPGMAISGRVTEFQSGKPIAGARVFVERLFRHDDRIDSAGRLRLDTRHIQAVTDDQGRFRLIGIPPGAGHVLNVTPPTSEPWLMAEQEFSLDADGTQPEATVNVQVCRGIWIEGRLTDAATGEPAPGYVDFLALQKNPNIPEKLGLHEAWEMSRFPVDPAGRYRVAGLPGPGVLLVRSLGKTVYPLSVGAEQVDGYEHNYLPTTPTGLPLSNWNLIRQIDPPVDAASYSLDLSLSAGSTVTGRLVLPGGQPAAQAEALGLVPKNPFFGPLVGDQFAVNNYEPAVPRDLYFRTVDHSLVAHLHLAGKPAADLTVRLQPAVTVKGRLIETETEAEAAGYKLFCKSTKRGEFRVDDVLTDENGRFEIKGLLAGNVYQMDAANPRHFVNQKNGFTIDLTDAKPGDVIELGDVTGPAAKAKMQTGKNDPPPARAAQSLMAAKSPKDKSPARASDVKSLRGRVLDAAGRPIAGARVRLLRIDTERITWVDQGQVVAEAKSETDGKFAIDFPLGKPFATREEFVSSSNIILADAENHVFDWQHVQPGEPEITLQLSAEDAPIEGRVLDLEGRPIAGVSVRVNEISGGAENLDQWVEQAKRNPASLDESTMARPISARNSERQPVVARYPGNKRLQPGLPSLLPAATTDENGSFRLAGLGRDRLVRLELAGAGIAKTWLNVVTREMSAVPYPNQDPRFRVQTCFGRRFKFAAEPEQPITGVVRDAESGRPLAGAEVRLNQYADSLLFVEGFLSAKTDEQGRYTLDGVPKPHNRERSHRLRIVPGADPPYFRTEFQVAKRDGFEPVQGDVKLKRAIWLRGRVVDRATGKPIHGLVEYYPFRSNQAAAAYANFNPGLHLMEGDGYATDEDGNYQIPVLPGRGLLAFIALNADRYPAGDGVDKIINLRQQDGRDLNVYHLLSLDLATAFREINPPPEAAEAVCDIELKSLDVARVKLLDEQGRPVAGAVTQRLAPHRIGRDQAGWSNDSRPDSSVEILGPRDQARTAMFLHRERKLAAAVLLTPQSDPPETIVLRPAATLSGRIVDREGKPIADLGITVSALSPPGAKPLPGWGRESLYYSHQLAHATTSPDGAFRIEQVPPGVAYVIYARHGAEETTTRVVEPGEKLDLGDVVLEAPNDAKAPQAKAPAKPEPAAVAPAGEAKAAKPASPDSSPKEAGSVTTLRGRVLDPDGKPQAGAKVYFWSPGEEMSKLEPKVHTAADGGFEFTVDRSKLKWLSADDPWTVARVIAAADGFGYEWAEAAQPGADGQYVIRLLKDVPIHGRILSLEGQPVAKAKLTLRNVNCFLNNNLDEYIQAEKTGSRNYGPGRFGRTPPGQPDMVETDADGRFTLSGIGAERVANLSLDGEGIANADLLAMTRETETVVLPENIVFRRMPDRTYGAKFTYLAQPSRLIRGVVRERETQQPIAGVTIIGLGGGFRRPTVKTDERGKFELHGLGKQDRYQIEAMPAYIYGPSPVNSPFLAATHTIDDTPGLDPLEVDFELVRGIQVSGRVTLAPEGRPNKAQVMYYPLRGNAYTDRIGPQLADPCSSATCDAEGRYTIPVLPGPGILCYRIGFEVGSAYREYLQAWMSREEIAKHFESVGLPLPPELGGDNSVLIATGGPAIRSILLSNFKQVAFINPADDATTLVSDIEFPLGRKLDVKLVDPDGKPVAGAIIRGDLNAPYHVAKSDPSEFTFVGLHPRVERRVIVESRERKLAAATVIQGDETGPLTIKLEPCGTVVGRALDVEGEPLANMQLQMPRPMYLPADFMPKTDGEGRFRVEGVVPGVTYNLEVNLPGRMGSHALAQNIIVKPGETKDLGDVRIKPPGAMQRPGGPRPIGGKPPSAPGAPAKPGDSTPKRDAGGKVPAKTIRGRVTRDGRPASGADVAVIARKTAAVRGGDFGPSGEVLAEGKADGNGEYSLYLADASAKSRAYAIIIARQEGAAIAWQQHNLETVDSEIDFELPAEEPIRGKLIDLEGRPAAGVRLTVRQISNQGKSGAASGVGYQGDKVPAAWLAPVVSDEQGRFVVHGVPAGHGVFMEVGQDERFAPQGINLSPGANEQRGERDATYRPLVKNLKPGEEAVLTLSPAQPFAGTVRYADSGEPAPHARISIWASQQERFGSMTSVGGRADEHGRYRISPKPGVRFGLIAYPPDGVPYLARQTRLDEPLRWNASERVKQVDLSLPRGVLVQGTIMETGGNTPVAGAAIQYIPETSNNPHASNDILTGWQAIQLSDEEGRFSIAVLPGPGRLLVSGQQGNHVLQPISELELSDGKPGGARNYAHAIAKLDPEVGQQTLEVKIELQPGATASGRIVDEQGQAIEEATVISRLNISPYSLFWRGHTTPTLGGRFELTGLAKDTEYPVYFLDPKRRLGATEIIKAGKGERTVVLKPCGQARLRAVDKSGEPGADHVSFEMAVTPGVFRYDFEAVRNGELAADADYIANIDRTNHWNRPQSDDQGAFVLPALIPGATYRVITGRGGTLKVVKEFQVQSNETLDLGEILIERSE